MVFLNLDGIARLKVLGSGLWLECVLSTSGVRDYCCHVLCGRRKRPCPCVRSYRITASSSTRAFRGTRPWASATKSRPVEPFLILASLRRWHEPSARRCSPSLRAHSALSSTGRCVACGARARRSPARRLLAGLRLRNHEALIGCAIIWSATSHAIRRQSWGARSHPEAAPSGYAETGRPRKGEQRLDKAPRAGAPNCLPEMLADLPCTCDVGVKRDAKGFRNHGAATSCRRSRFPLSCILTSASLHDSSGDSPNPEAARVTNSMPDGLVMTRPRSERTVSRWGMLQSSTPIPAFACWNARPRRGRSVPSATCTPSSYATVRACQWSSQGRVRRSPSPSARSRQGAVPPDVRHGGADSVAVDAPVELKPTSFHPSPLAGVLSRQGHAGQVCSYTAKETHCRWIVAAQKCCSCPDDVSDAETSK